MPRYDVNEIRKRIALGNHATANELVHVALRELGWATTAIGSSWEQANFHQRQAEIYARLAQVLKGNQ